MDTQNESRRNPLHKGFAKGIGLFTAFTLCFNAFAFSGTLFFTEETVSAEETSEPITYSGSGDQVIKDLAVPEGIYKVNMTNTGNRNFIVHAYTAEGTKLSSLANEIGNYEGSVVLTDNIDGGMLEVTSDGSWTIAFCQIEENGTSNLAGSGDWVSPWFTLESGALAVEMTNTGEYNFIVHIYDENGKRYSSLANEIGNYSGTVVFNRGEDGKKYCIEVISDGEWTVDFGLGDTLTEKAE